MRWTLPEPENETDQCLLDWRKPLHTMKKRHETSHGAGKTKKNMEKYARFDFVGFWND